MLMVASAHRPEVAACRIEPPSPLSVQILKCEAVRVCVLGGEILVKGEEPMQKIGQVLSGTGGTIGVWLGEGDRGALVELRREGRRSAWRESAPFTIPLDQLPLFIGHLREAEQEAAQPPPSHPVREEIVVMERGEPVILPGRMRGLGHPVRRHPRVRLTCPVSCQPVAPLAGDPVAGELLDLSAGGAGVDLPCRLDLFQRVDLRLTLDGQTFGGSAQVVSADLTSERDPRTGNIRHGLEWCGLDSAATDILSGWLKREKR
jgi:hypothetical protein